MKPNYGDGDLMSRHVTLRGTNVHIPDVRQVNGPGDGDFLEADSARWLLNHLGATFLHLHRQVAGDGVLVAVGDL